MCIYCGTPYYRLIYENHNSSIPKDSSGRSYEIHHKDGNHSNNDPLNLQCVSIKEHFNIHYEQGDFAACKLIMTRMDISPEEHKITCSLKGNRNPSYDPTIHTFYHEDGIVEKCTKFELREKYKLKSAGTLSSLVSGNTTSKRLC